MLTRTQKILAALCVLVALVGLMSACETESSDSKSAREREQDATARAMNRMTQSQQVPEFDYSQERQTLIELLTVRAQGTHGTAYVTALDGTLLWWCPTQGAPVPSTYQLTNPEQVVGRGGHNHYEGQTIGLAEPTGVYSGDSAATWVICLDDAGKPFAQYDEANVRWTSGIVNDMPEDKRARVDEITFTFTESPGE